jgi:hypothetical protein
VVLTTFKQTDKLTIPKTWQHHAMFQLSLRWHSSVMWKGSALIRTHNISGNRHLLHW